MSEQFALFEPPTIARARALRDEAIERVAAKAEEEGDDFAHRAYAFLVRYVAEHTLINPEDVSFAAAKAGIAAHDARAWGSVFRKARGRGLIQTQRRGVSAALRARHRESSLAIGKGCAMKPDHFTLPLGFRDELVVDNFAGGGGASTGLEQALGRPVDIAINHDEQAVAMHATNPPEDDALLASRFTK